MFQLEISDFKIEFTKLDKGKPLGDEARVHQVSLGDDDAAHVEDYAHRLPIDGASDMLVELRKDRE